MIPSKKMLLTFVSAAAAEVLTVDSAAAAAASEQEDEVLRINDVTRVLLSGALLIVSVLSFKDSLATVVRSLLACPASVASSSGRRGGDSAAAADGLSGPRGLPFVGYLPFLVGRSPHRTLAALARRHGPVFRLSAGCRDFVVVSSLEKVLAMARRYPEQLYGKPRTFTTQALTSGAHNDMLHRWKRRRAYTNAGLKYLERYSATDIVQEEVGNLVEYVRSVAAVSPVARDVRHQMSYFVSRVLYRMSYGGQPDAEAERGLRRLVDTMPDYTTTIGSFSPFDLLPFLRHVIRRKFRRFVEFNRFMSDFCRAEKLKCLKKETSSADPSAEPPADLLNFFRRKWERMSEWDRVKFSLTDDVLYDGLEDIIRAGTESSSLLIHWFLLYATVFPHVQATMFSELDEYLSGRKSRDVLAVEDLANLPYCQAVLAETYRFCCLNPFLKRELTGDIQLDSVHLPRGTVILINNWAINNDPDHWARPSEFLPERFLRSDGSLDREKTEGIIPFGFGKRKCIGIDTGRSLCALAAVSLVRNFEMSLDKNSKPDLDAIFGIGLSPKEFKVQFRKR